jgi:hypothetical protein
LLGASLDGRLAPRPIIRHEPHPSGPGCFRVVEHDLDGKLPWPLGGNRFTFTQTDQHIRPVKVGSGVIVSRPPAATEIS